MEGYCILGLLMPNYDFIFEMVHVGNDGPTVNVTGDCVSCKTCTLKGMPCVIHHLGSVHTTYTYII